MEEFLRVRLGRVGADLVATPLPRGAGSVTSITQADAIVRIAPDLEGVPAGAPITAELLRPLSLIEQSIVCVGSHDSCLDLLDDELRQRHPGMRLCSSHVGSMGGLVALGRGACHLAGSHLLDPSDGSYNLSYLRKHLPGVPVRIIHLAMRQQGLMVAAGNPKDIQALAELARPGVRFVNRQGGSGTRLLLDTQLAALGIDAGRIDGYRLEELTHMAVAVAVASGAADAGLGVLSAARALGLDFVPVVEEQYDLLIPARFFDTAPLRALVDTVRSATFQARVKALGGYGTARTGIELAV
jgi:putative molybdopterin biosynthesis protein